MARGILHRERPITHDDLRKFFLKGCLSILRQPGVKKGHKKGKTRVRWGRRTRVGGLRGAWAGKLF
jgi:hypothetical protein